MEENGVEYYTRTYTLKTKDGIFAWMYDDGTERFPGMTFATAKEAQDYVDNRYGKTFVVFEKRT